MVAPAGGNESISYTIKIDAAQAKKALEDIIQSEASVDTKTRQIKDLMIQFANSTNSSIEKVAQTFKKLDDVFAGTSKSIINAAQAAAKAQLLPDVGVTPTKGEVTAPDYEAEAAIAQAMSRQKIEALQEEQKYKKAVHDEAMKDAELERQSAAAVAEARVNAALAEQAANQKVSDSVRNIITANTSVETKVTQLKNLIIQMAQESGKSIEQVTADIKKMDAAFAGTSKSVVDLASKAAKQQLFPTQEANGFAAALNQIGVVGQAALGVTLVGALRSVIDYMKQAVDMALEFSQAQVELQIGARATQRMGNDTTIQEYYKEIADIQKKYPLFSKEQATEAYTNALVLTRGLKMTKEQFQQLIDVSASASIVMGRDFGETATGIAKSLSSGWFEAAQRAGFLISRQAVVNEGLAMGIENAKSGYNAMTEYERAYAALNRYVKENGSIQQDVGTVMESQAGKVKVAKAEWDNLKLAIGQFFATIAVGTGATSWLTKFFQSWEDAFGKAGWGIAGIRAFIDTVKEFMAILFMPRQKGIPFIDQIKQGLEELTHFSFGDRFNKNLVDEVKKAELVPTMGNAGKDAGAAFGDGMEQGMGDKVAEAFQKLLYDIQDEQTKLKNRLEDLWTDYLRKLEDITTDTNNAIAAANAKYEQDVANVGIDFSNRRAEAERKYRINELNAEARFQEQLRQLREKFLFDLEDALRERDARQVLRLTRQYRMDKENITKEAELAAKERRRAYEEELRQLAEQQAEKLRILQQQHENELAQIRQADAQKRADALLAYERNKADAEKASAERIKQQILDFQRQYQLTESQAKALVNLLSKYYGTSGPVAQLYRNLVSYIMALAALAATGIAALGGFATQTPNTIPGTTTPVPGGTHAKGGTFYANKPTVAIYGEAGPEYATFTPASKLRQHETQVASNINVSGNSQVGGNLRVMVELSPDLVASIIDDTMSGVTTVVRDINRQR